MEQINNVVDENKHGKNGDTKRKRVQKITHIAIFSALSLILYVAHVPPFVFPIFPPPFNFLEMNFSEVPALIGAFAHGPVAGFIILLVRMFLKPLFMPSTTMYVGEIADLIYSSAFIIPAAIVYKKRRNFKSVLVGLAISFAIQLLVSTAANYFIVHELYNQMFFRGNIPFTREQFIVYVFPFNLIKNTIIAVLTVWLYKRIMVFLNQLTA